MAQGSHVSSSTENCMKHRKVRDDVPFPLQYRLTVQDVFEGAGVPNLACLRRHFHGEGRLDLDCLLRIVRDTRAALARESNVVYLSGTIRVVGAICGQFYDLLEILKRVNFDEGEKCVFLGNFSWDGSFNTETVLYLYAHKLVYPDHVILLRSQRETRLCSKTTFKLECETKYSLDVYEDFCQSFDHLPLVAIINKYTMCVHGGISPKALDLAHIDAINRFEEPPPRGAMTDLLWADPDPNFGQEAPTTPCFTFNRDRLISVFFTCEALKHFMKRNRLTCLIRANQPLFDGFVEYQMPVQAKDEHKYSMKGVFSAPNFKGKRNQGAMLVLTPSKVQVEHFLWVASPYWLPNFADCFTWSLPFLVHKATLFVSDLLEIMDRDTAASDVKDALMRSQERSKFLGKKGKDLRQDDSCKADSLVMPPSRHVIFKNLLEEEELHVQPGAFYHCSDDDNGSDDDEDDEEKTTTTCRLLRACLGSVN